MSVIDDNAKRVVLVEDDRAVATTLTAMLRRAGWGVVGTAATAAEGIDRVLEHAPAFALVDVGLDGDLDGVNLVAACREHHDCGVIFLTAWDDDATLQRMLSVAPDGILYKPMQYGQLVATLAVATHRRAAEQNARHDAATLRRMVAASEGRLALRDGSHGSRGSNGHREALLRQLTDREREVVELFLEGFRADTIADYLHLSGQTVRNHLKRIQRRLDVHSQGELREMFAMLPR